MPTDLITQVFDQSDAKTLLTFGRGIEREALRTDSNGQLAQTPHPESLGEKLTHPLITTDFSEAQLELITPVHASNESVLAHLENIHQWTAQRLGEEVLLPGFLPHHGAKLHVLNIVTTQVVAMQHDSRADRRSDDD